MTTRVETQAEMGFTDVPKGHEKEFLLERGQAITFKFGDSTVRMGEYDDNRPQGVGIGYINVSNSGDRTPLIEGDVADQVTSYVSRSNRLEAVLEEGGMAIVSVPLRGDKSKSESFMVTNLN